MINKQQVNIFEGKLKRPTFEVRTLMLDKNKRQNKIIKRIKKNDVVDKYESKKLGMKVVRDEDEELSTEQEQEQEENSRMEYGYKKHKHGNESDRSVLSEFQKDKDKEDMNQKQNYEDYSSFVKKVDESKLDKG